MQRLYDLHHRYAMSFYLLAVLTVICGYLVGWWTVGWAQTVVLMAVGWIGGYTFLAILVDRKPPLSNQVDPETAKALEEVVRNVHAQQALILQRLEELRAKEEEDELRSEVSSE